MTNVPANGARYRSTPGKPRPLRHGGVRICDGHQRDDRSPIPQGQALRFAAKRND